MNDEKLKSLNHLAYAYLELVRKHIGGQSFFSIGKYSSNVSPNTNASVVSALTKINNLYYQVLRCVRTQY